MLRTRNFLWIGPLGIRLAKFDREIMRFLQSPKLYYRICPILERIGATGIRPIGAVVQQVN